jgi:glycosyltransferase involved in cell wall biosynthesis
VISICMAYRNRISQFTHALKTIRASKCSDYEIIIVDDASNDNHRIDDLVKEYSCQLIRIEPEDKKWYNPCIPYNIAFKHARGDKIIIQNPECAHVGDILSFVESNLTDSTYFSFSCLSLPEDLTNKCYQSTPEQFKDEILAITSGVSHMSTYDGDLGWYNHSQFAPRGLHFCSAIMAKDLEETGGFDERFAQGYNFDDNELAVRIYNTEGMRMFFIDDPMVVHLNHYADCNTGFDPLKSILCDQNSIVYNAIMNGSLPRWSKKIKNESI